MTSEEIRITFEDILNRVYPDAEELGFMDHDNDPLFVLRGERVYTVTLIVAPAPPSLNILGEINAELQLHDLWIYRGIQMGRRDQSDTYVWELGNLEDARRILRGEGVQS